MAQLYSKYQVMDYWFNWDSSVGYNTSSGLLGLYYRADESETLPSTQSDFVNSVLQSGGYSKQVKSPFSRLRLFRVRNVVEGYTPGETQTPGKVIAGASSNADNATPGILTMHIVYRFMSPTVPKTSATWVSNQTIVSVPNYNRRFLSGSFPPYDFGHPPPEIPGILTMLFEGNPYWLSGYSFTLKAGSANFSKDPIDEYGTEKDCYVAIVTAIQDADGNISPLDQIVKVSPSNPSSFVRVQTVRPSVVVTDPQSQTTTLGGSLTTTLDGSVVETLPSSQTTTLPSSVVDATIVAPDPLPVEDTSGGFFANLATGVISAAVPGKTADPQVVPVRLSYPVGGPVGGVVFPDVSIPPR